MFLEPFVVFTFTVTSIIMLSSCTGGLESASVSGAVTENTPVISNDTYLPSKSVYSVLIKSGTIFVSHSKGISISKDNGVNWKNIRIGCTSGTCGTYEGTQGITYTDQNKLFAATRTGLIWSTDEGDTWTRVSADPDSSSLTVGLVEFAGVIFTSLYSGSNPNGFSFTSDNGSSWTNRAITSAGNTVQIRRFAVKNSNWIAATNSTDGNCIRKSSDQGITWSNITPPAIVAPDCPSDMVVTNSDIILGTNSGIYVSTDEGTTWNLKTTAHGLNSNYTSALGFDNNSRIWSVGLLSTNLNSSTDHGASWTVSAVGLTGFNIQKIFASGTLVVLTSLTNGLAISTNSGVTFTKVTVVE